MRPERRTIEVFLQRVDKLFPTPLSQKQDLQKFADKLSKHATLCTVMDGEEIQAMVAGYTEHVSENKAYISVVAVLPHLQGRGYASRLVKEFISISEKAALNAVHLYTVSTNTAAVKMYQKLGFVPWSMPGETRPEDLHLIYYIGNEE